MTAALTLCPSRLSLILGRNFVFSFQEGIKGDVLDPLRQRIRGSKGKIRKMGADYLVYSIVDGIVDNYFAVLEKLGEQIELLEEEVVTDPKPETLQKIHYFKREMLYISTVHLASARSRCCARQARISLDKRVNRDLSAGYL